MIDRPDHLSAIRAALERSRIVALTGPRQCGKTTLARQLLPEDSVNYFDLEDPVSIARLDFRDFRGQYTAIGRSTSIMNQTSAQWGHPACESSGVDREARQSVQEME